MVTPRSSSSGGDSPRSPRSPRSPPWNAVRRQNRRHQGSGGGGSPRMRHQGSGGGGSPRMRRRQFNGGSRMPRHIPAPALFEMGQEQGGQFVQTPVREVYGRTEEQYQVEARQRDATLQSMQHDLDQLNLSTDERRSREEELREQSVLRRAYVLATDPTGSTILVQNASASDRRRPGRWSIPGGCRNLGEAFHEAANREVSEELGRHAFIVPRDAERMRLPTGDMVFLHQVEEFAPPTIIGVDATEIASIAVLSANNVWQLVGDRSLRGWNALNRPTQYAFSERQDLFRH